MLNRKLFGTLSLAALTCGVLSASTRGGIVISEVAPWSSGNSAVADDWFEVTNTGPTAVNIGGWKMDDNSGSFSASVALNGITSIAAGESVIFIETSGSHTAAGNAAAFRTLWFGSNPPPALQVGNYAGSGVGLSTSGDAVNLYDGGGTLQANVSFNASPGGPFPTFDNSAGLNNTTISQLSAVGTNGAFVAPNDANEIGSPGLVPEPASLASVIVVTLVASAARRRRNP